MRQSCLDLLIRRIGCCRYPAIVPLAFLAAFGLVVACPAQVPATVLGFGREQPNATPIWLGLVGGAVLGGLADHAGPWRTVYP